MRHTHSNRGKIQDKKNIYIYVDQRNGTFLCHNSKNTAEKLSKIRVKNGRAPPRDSQRTVTI